MLQYKVYQEFRLNIGIKRRDDYFWVTVHQFLIKLHFLSAVRAVAKIGSSLKAKH